MQIHQEVFEKVLGEYVGLPLHLQLLQLFGFHEKCGRSEIVICKTVRHPTKIGIGRRLLE